MTGRPAVDGRAGDAIAAHGPAPADAAANQRRDTLLRPPRLFFVIGSYQPPASALRLVQRLMSARVDAECVVLRDRGAQDVSQADVAPASLWLTPEPVRWGDGSYLRALLYALHRLEMADDDWVTILSETSYPVRPLRDYRNHLLTRGADALLEQSILVNPDRDQLLARYTARTLRVPASTRPQVARAVQGLARRAGVRVQATDRAGVPVRIDVPRRRTPFGPGLQVRMGSDFFALKGTAVRAVTAERFEDLRRYLDRAFVPSEAYFHTVVLNDPALRNLAEPTHYLKWSGGAHPEELSVDDLAVAFASGAWFARKFGDPAVLDEVERRIDA